MEFETKAIHTGKRPDPAYGAVAVPIYQTSTFAFEEVGKAGEYDYSRTANPTRSVLEETIAALEGGQAGFAFATGMAAEATVIHLLKTGDHVICGDDCYGGTYRLFADVMTPLGIEFSFVRLSSRENIENALRPNTRMLWIETPSNPLLTIVDLEMVVDIARRHKLLTVLDNTFATPYLLKPIEFGVDIVVHSTTKYLNGHCDVVGGAVVTATAEMGEKVHFLLNAMGTCAAPFDSWLVLRGIETLALRMERHQQNAAAVAEYLAGQPGVERVFYPGLKTHPGHDVARRQMRGFGGMVSFEIKVGQRQAEDFLRGLKLFAVAESLGGAASLAELPATMSHASMPPEFRKKVGISDNLVRLSIGLENKADLIADLESGFKLAGKE